MKAGEMANADVAARPPWGIGATVVWGGIALVPFALALYQGWLSTAAGEAVNIVAQLFTLMVAVAAARLAGWHAPEYLGFSRPTLRHVALGVGAKFALSLSGSVVLFAISVLSPMAQVDAAPLLERTPYLAKVLLFWISSALVGPICEEVLWRGFVYRGLASSALGPAGAIMVISPIFAVLHLYEWSGTVWVLLSAILFGWLRWRTGSLTAPIAAHVFGNGIAAAIVTFQS
jgi:membrane protease YdiL (CAAX protease family)